jgi:hypothetical protein
LHEVPLQHLEKLWKFWESRSPHHDRTALPADSLNQPMTPHRLFGEGLEIAGGMFNARILFLPKSIPTPQSDSLRYVVPSMADFHVSGALQVRNGQLSFGELMPVTVQALNCDAQLKDDTLQLISRQRVNQQPVRLSGMIHFDPHHKPKFDLAVTSDSLMAAEFLLPFLRPAKGDSSAAGSSFPIRGRAAFHGWIRGSFEAPKLEAKIHAPDLLVYNQHVQHLAAHLQYAPSLNGSAGDSTLKFVECTGELEGLHWKGWGELNLRHPLRQLRMNLLAHGELAPAFLNFLTKENASSFGPSRYNANIEAQIFGPLKAQNHWRIYALSVPGGIGKTIENKCQWVVGKFLLASRYATG